MERTKNPVQRFLIVRFLLQRQNPGLHTGQMLTRLHQKLLQQFRIVGKLTRGFVLFDFRVKRMSQREQRRPKPFLIRYTGLRKLRHCRGDHPDFGTYRLCKVLAHRGKQAADRRRRFRNRTVEVLRPESPVDYFG